ncbi:fumarylacetoacetate hydrolase family protein [Bordetella flabilis]
MLLNAETVFDLTSAWLHEGGSNAPAHVGDLLALGDQGMQQAEALLLTHAGDARFVAPLPDVRLLAPIPRPAKNIFCIGRNYREHIIEGNRARGRDPHDFPKAIEVFTKPPTSVIGPDAVIAAHAHITRELDYEVELGVVIGKGGIDIPAERAMEHVFGYTVINDISARDLQKAHGQWFRGKALDRHCPMGPCIVHKRGIPDPHALSIQLDVNGERRQDSNTSDLLFKIPDIIAQLSRGMTLEAGDIIATGTPSGVGLGLVPPRYLQKGDVVTARIEGLGILRNPIGD